MRQIVLEIHDLQLRLFSSSFHSFIKNLENLMATHQVIHAHANNHRSTHYFGRLPLPSMLELTLVRRDSYDFGPPIVEFPTRLDRPNAPTLWESKWYL